MIVEDFRVQVISATQSEFHPFTGLQPAQFRCLVRLVALRGGDAVADGRPGRPWALHLADRVLLVAVYWRTNLTMRQIGLAAVRCLPLSSAPGHRQPRPAAGHGTGPLPARVDQVTIVDGTLIPTRDHTLAAPSKNYRYSTNLQVAIDASTRLVVALGDPRPGNRNDTVVYRSSGIKHNSPVGRPWPTAPIEATPKS